jgi:hypothetical protein
MEEDTSGADSADLPVLLGWDCRIFAWGGRFECFEADAGWDDPVMWIPLFGHDERRQDGPFDWVGGFEHDVDEVEAETLVGVDNQQPLGVTLEEGSDN